MLDHVSFSLLWQISQKSKEAATHNFTSVGSPNKKKTLKKLLKSKHTHTLHQNILNQ